MARRADGLFCTAPESLSREELKVLKDAFGDRLSLGTYRHLDGEDARREREVVSKARDLGKGGELILAVERGIDRAAHEACAGERG